MTSFMEDEAKDIVYLDFNDLIEGQHADLPFL